MTEGRDMPAGASRVGHTDRRARANYRVRSSPGGPEVLSGVDLVGQGGTDVNLHGSTDDLPGG